MTISPASAQKPTAADLDVGEGAEGRGKFAPGVPVSEGCGRGLLLGVADARLRRLPRRPRCRHPGRPPAPLKSLLRLLRRHVLSEGPFVSLRLQPETGRTVFGGCSIGISGTADGAAIGRVIQVTAHNICFFITRLTAATSAVPVAPMPHLPKTVMLISTGRPCQCAK